MATRRTIKSTAKSQTNDYQHSQEATQRTDVGVLDHFTTRKSHKTNCYDNSLDPALSWDENRDRELAEWRIGLVPRCATEGESAVFGAPEVLASGGVQVQSFKAAADLLMSLPQPFLNWAGSEPFALGLEQCVAVKVIDESGNELIRTLEARA